MSEEDGERPREVSIGLTSAQVTRVLQEAAGTPALETMLDVLRHPDAVRRAAHRLLEDPTYSRSTLRAILVLAAFPVDGRPIEVTDLAGELGLSPSTTYRYVSTWLALGLLEQDPRSRRYRRSPPLDA
jgi:hypothetical protein